MTKGETYTLLHQHWLHTSLNGACYHLLQHHSDQPVVLYIHSAIVFSYAQYGLLFIRDKSPEVDLEVVGIHLHLLQAKLAECSQSHTFK